MLLSAVAWTAAGCASWGGAPSIRVDLAGIDSLPGEGLELRLLVRLRVQNRGDADLAYDGIWTEIDLGGQTLASGAAPLKGVVPRYGETVLALPVTASGLNLARQALLWMRSSGEGRRDPGPVRYTLRGALGGTGFAAARFDSSGEIDLRLR